MAHKRAVQAGDAPVWISRDSVGKWRIASSGNLLWNTLRHFRMIPVDRLLICCSTSSVFGVCPGVVVLFAPSCWGGCRDFETTMDGDSVSDLARDIDTLSLREFDLAFGVCGLIRIQSAALAFAQRLQGGVPSCTHLIFDFLRDHLG